MSWAPAISSWSWLLAGLSLCAATILLPAREDLIASRWRRDQAAAEVAFVKELIDRHRRYLSALESGEPALLVALAERHTRQVLDPSSTPVGPLPPADSQIDLYMGLEVPAAPRVRPTPDPASGTILARLVADPKSRVMLAACGAVLVFIGLLPTARGHRP